MTGPAAGWLPGGRLHLQHGPIDLVIEASGSGHEVAAAYRQAWAAFRPVLDDLVAVLPILRTPVADLASAGVAGPPPIVGRGHTLPDGPHTVGSRPTESLAAVAAEARQAPWCAPLPSRAGGTGKAHLPGGRVAAPAIAPELSPVAAAMIRAATRHAPAFVTPMAAVAGAVADHVLSAMTAGRRLERAYVNNGGDVALWLAPGAGLTAAGGPGLADRIRIAHDSPVRGIATSGWRGRSQSLGIADAVTVLARTAAGADVAATLIANAVDLPGHPAVTRRPACELAPDSDLGDRPVTVAVGPLSPEDVTRALVAGRRAAEAMHRAGLIEAAALWLDGESVTVGALDPAAGAAVLPR